MSAPAEIDRRAARAGAGLLGLSGALIWAVSQMAWMTVDYRDDLAGDGTATLRGADWSTELSAVAVLLVAGMVAGFALRRTGRRVVGAVCAVAAAASAVPGIRLLAGGADAQRVHAILSAGADAGQAVSQSAQSAQSAQSGAQAVISQWADIASVAVLPAGPSISVLGSVLGVVGALILVLRPGGDAPRQHKYEKEAVRMDNVRADLEEDPSSGRVLWDALSAGIDPTQDPTQEGDFGSPGRTR